MNLPFAGCCSLPILPRTAANYSRRFPRTLSATAKKPASLAGFLSRGLNISRLTVLFLPASPLSAPLTPFSSLFKLQVALNPA